MSLAIGIGLLVAVIGLVLVGRGRSGQGAAFLGDGLLSLTYPTFVIMGTVIGLGFILN